MKAQFTGLLNRRDLTPALTTIFFDQSISRCQRDLRIPAMEKSVTATIGNLYTSGLDVPGDLLQLISISDVKAARELSRRALPEVLNAIKYETVGNSRIFARRVSKFLLGPAPITGDVLRMDYYATFTPLVADGDSNILSDVAPDLIIYGALTYAATYYLDKRLAEFEARFSQIHNALDEQALRDELTGGAQVSPASNYPEDCTYYG